MSQPPYRPSQPYRGATPLPSPFPSRPLSRVPSQTPYRIQPTPTFSFADEPMPGPLYKPRRSGGGLGLLLLVVVAGAGGYFAVQTRVWQDAEPIVARAKELARSLRTLVPGASPVPAPAAPTVTAPAGSATIAAPVAAEPTPAAPALHPDVVPIAPDPSPASRRASETSHHASHAHHEHAARARAPGASARLSDEAAAEEELLSAPSGGR